ncbi:MAG: VCBS repeat-containing protein [Proteobacteria bacterium]|nr:VCBS repeat-containing protein [Pseudomonadota bacterium]
MRHLLLLPLSTAALLAAACSAPEGPADLVESEVVGHVALPALDTVESWSTGNTDASDSFASAWGDVDGDGWLDLAIAIRDEPDRLYLNTGGTLAAAPIWTSPTPRRADPWPLVTPTATGSSISPSAPTPPAD